MRAANVGGKGLIAAAKIRVAKQFGSAKSFPGPGLGHELPAIGTEPELFVLVLRLSRRKIAYAARPHLAACVILRARKYSNSAI